MAPSNAARSYRIPCPANDEMKFSRRSRSVGRRCDTGRVAVPLRSTMSRRLEDGVRHSVYRTWAPDPVTSAAVRCSWLGVPGWARTIRLLPDGCVDIVWDGGRLTAVAVGSAPGVFDVPPAGHRIGVRLRCGAAGGLLGEHFTAFVPGQVALSELVSERTSAVGRAEDRLAEITTPDEGRVILLNLVAGWLRRGPGPDPMMPSVVRLLAGPTSRVDLMSERLGVSERALRRRVRAAVGMSPKELHRILRFRGFMTCLPRIAEGHTSVAVVAADLGYADQSHLGRECRRLSGSSPARLLDSWRGSGAVAEIFQTRPRPDAHDLGHEPTRRA